MIGVIIARFQTPFLHDGHKHLIDSIKEAHSKCIIVLGVSQIKGSQRSPYDYFTREKMIKAYDPDLIVLPIMDMPSDQEWSKQLDMTLSGVVVGENFTLYGSRDSFIKYYSGRFKCKELSQKGNYNATEIRDQLKDRVKSSEDFRSGILYGICDRFPVSYSTVDIACISHGKILLGRKSAHDTLRLPGGFVDPSDNSLEAAAARELREECGPIEVGKMNYEMSTNIDDWRYRGEVDCIKTTLFTCDHVFGKAEAGDDLVSVEWVPIKELPIYEAGGKLNPAHRPLFEYIFNIFSKKQ